MGNNPSFTMKHFYGSIMSLTNTTRVLKQSDLNPQSISFLGESIVALILIPKRRTVVTVKHMVRFVILPVHNTILLRIHYVTAKFDAFVDIFKTAWP